VNTTARTPGARKGLSGEAWAAIGVLGAALITGAVTLLVHVLPGPDTPSAPPAAVSANPTTGAAQSPTTGAGDSPVAQMIGSWKGTAKGAGTATFKITLDVSRYCQLRELCGSIAILDVPCYGDIYLENASGQDVEFKVQDFKAGSSSQCTPGAGEHFRLAADGSLSYYASYNDAHGALSRA
jgi:hypothetical protein